jgi:hypothetical protein
VIFACGGSQSPSSSAVAAILPSSSAVAGDLGLVDRSPSPAVAEFSPGCSVAPEYRSAADSQTGVGLAAAAAETSAVAAPPVAASSARDVAPAAAAHFPSAAEGPAAGSAVSPVFSPVVLMHDAVCLDTHVAEGSPTAGSDFGSFLPGSPSGVHGTDRMAGGTGVFLGGRYSNEELISFGGIPNSNASIRSSERIRAQYNADDTQMEWAMHLAEAKNIGSFQGTNAHSKFFLHSISHDDIVARTLKLGVALGSSDCEVSNTIDEIKRSDANRTMIMLSKNIDEKMDVQLDLASTTLNQATLLANDLEDEETALEAEDILNLTLAEIKKHRKGKKVLRAKPVVIRRSSRLKK